MTSLIDDDNIPEFSDTAKPDTRDKRELREEVSQHVAEFLAKGGKIKQVDDGAHTVDYARPRAWKDTAKASFIINAEKGGTHGLHEK